MKPTADTYKAFQVAFDFLNRELFAGELPPCMLTLQRSRHYLGFFHASRFTSRKGKRRADEIAMNPDHFWSRSDEETVSTLAHEMVHLWQQHNGKPGRRGYHNREWAEKMKEIGPQPSDTAREGGKETGERVSHYILKDGRFSTAWKKLRARKFSIPWGDVNGKEPESKRKKKKRAKARNKRKYTCPGCDLNAWGKPELNLICGDCGEHLEEE